ncbi:MAG: ATP/GTP-binding protein [Bacteroidales bacterium]|nr:ATP/GTP-binding protein [Bacteroidales bacterium]
MKNDDDNKKEDVYPRFLDNKPCEQDLFEGKSHDAIAQNIANLLVNNDAKIIGIDGGWGAGKSNMVYLIKNKLDRNKFHFFIYDAWGHQTDFQRRSILENLTGFLVDDAKILDKEKWNSKLLQLLSRKRSVGSKIVKELSAVAKVSAVVALAMPLLMLINGYINNNTGRIVYWVAVFVVALACLVAFQIKNMKKYGQHITFLNIISELFLSYMDYTHEKNKDSIEQSIKYETIYDEEPSTRDFKNWMKEIDKDINNHTLIIVFDNMDRLPQEKVQELWSAIHTFFAEKKYNNIHVIVPFDREHIKSAFKSEDIITYQRSSEKGSGGNNNVNNKKVCFGNDFINKTFDAVYRVSPPIMSEWKSYFANQWKDAFGIEVDNRITQIYDLLSETITPREIIAFINEIVAIKQISDNSIPNEYIALFVKGKEIISACPDEEILHPSYLGALDFMYKNDTELPKYISALYYQLPVDKALDIIYTDNLKRALDNGDEEQIKSIQSNPHLFFLVLENAITKITNISNAVKVLDVCLSKDSSLQEQMIWDCICENIKQQPIYYSLQEYQRILLKRITEKDEYLQTIVSALCDDPDIDVLGYYNSIRLLSEDGFDPFTYLHEKEYSPESFIYFVEQAKGDYKRYKIICDQKELDKYLSKLDVKELDTLSAIPYIKNDYGLSPYLNHLETLVDSSKNNKENIAVLYTRLKELERPVSKKLPDVLIQVFFNQIKDTEVFYYDLICMRISRLNNFTANLRPAFKAVLDRKDDEFVERVAERIEYYISYGDILLNVDTISSPLYLEVAKKLTEKSYGQSTMDVVAIIQKYDTIKSTLGITPDLLINRIDSWSDDLQTRITEDMIASISVEFFKDIKTIDSNVSSCCIKAAKGYLNSKSKEEWKQSILAGNYEYQLLMIIKLNIQACFDAFKELLVENAQSVKSAFTKLKCDQLIKLLENNGRNMLSAFNTVRDRFCDGACAMTTDKFDFYGEWLLKYAKLEDKSSALRTIFISSVLDKKENIQIVLKYQDKMIKIVEIAKEENKDFKDKIRFLLDRVYKDDTAFESFAKKIGVNKSIINKLKDSVVV